MSHASQLSNPVRSAQIAVHPRLREVVLRHLRNPWQLKPHDPSVEAFAALAGLLSKEASRPLILDSGCGTGIGTRSIAAMFPDSWVIGIDQSANRLARAGARHFPHIEGNIIWLRAELATFWFQARQAGWKLTRHYLLYPNPWPKASQLRRRWYGHPVFPTLLALGGALQIRCNWRIYAEEFAVALRLAQENEVLMRELQTSAISSAFEIKYHRSGMPLYEIQVDLNS